LASPQRTWAVTKIVDLDGANLSSAKLFGTDLRGVDLSEANLSEAIGISNKELEKEAKSLQGVTMLDGTKHD
jgi:uncharacterized protein YjbI with pentapeptide repeats